jgi:hypothetical protein
MRLLKLIDLLLINHYFFLSLFFKLDLISYLFNVIEKCAFPYITIVYPLSFWFILSIL